MIQKWKKGLAAVLCGLLLLPFTAGIAVQAETEDFEGPDVCAEGYIVMNAETGEILAEKNMDETYYPASITKILTALVVIEEVDDLSEEITFTKSAVTNITEDSSTLVPVAQAGETMTVRDVLYGLLLSSGNECANMLAEYVAGSNEAFAKLMNKKAKALGAENSHFTNPSGLHDDDHYTTPHDMALIFQAALENETFLEIDSSCSYTIPATNKSAARELTMGHKFVNGLLSFDGVFAGKTGLTTEAGRTLVTAAKRTGTVSGEETTLITVIMKSEEDKFYADTKILLEYGFALVNHEITEVNWTDVEETVVATGSVRIREYPSIYADIVGSLQEDNTITRLGTWGKWSKVEYNGGIYYVASAYLKTNGTDASPAETSTAAETVQNQTDSSEELTTIAESNTQSAVTEAETTSTQAEVTTAEQSSSGWNVLQITIAVCIALMVLIAAGSIGYAIYSRHKRKHDNKISSSLWQDDEWFR